MSKLRILAGLLAAAFVGNSVAQVAPDTPAGFYVVVPLGPARAAAAAEGIEVTLEGRSLPLGHVGLPYEGFNFMNLLTVTGDPGYTGYGVKWEVVSGTIPAGLTLNADGTLTGTPTATGTEQLTLRATYKTKTGENSYELVVGRIVVAIAAGTPPQAIVGQTYSYDLKPLLSVSGDPSYAGTGVTWSIVSNTLPAGITLRTDGTISGTPTAGGTGNIVARAAYRGSNGEQTFEVVSLAVSVNLASANPPQAIVGQNYTYDLKPLLSVQGDGSYNGAGVTWTALSDNLPAGLSLRTDGSIAGMPTAAGSGFITVRAAYRGVNDEQAYEVITLAINVALGAATPPQAIVGQAYVYDLKNNLTVTGDNAYNGSGVTWAVVSNTLPAGLSLRANGTIAGTPTAAGSGAVTARATYRNVNGEQSYQVVTIAINVALASATPPQAIVGQAYTYDLKPLLTVGGDPAYNGSGVTWAVVSSTLPDGLTLRANGTIAGTPSAAGTGTLTARATYRGQDGQQAYQVVSLNVKVTLAADTPPQAIVGQAYAYNIKPLLSVTGDNGYNGSGVTWTTVSSTLAAGLTLGGDGTISGTPTASGTGSITARATYRGVNGEQTYQVVTLKITVALGTASLPQAIVGQAYSYDIKPHLSVTGDNAYNGSGVTWTVVSSTLPAGLALKSDGTIGGTPTASGTGSVTARATYRNVNGQQAYEVVTLGITVTLAAGSPPQAIVGQAYSYDIKPLLSVSGDPAYNGSGVTWTVVSSSLAPGLQLLNSGVISGTPTAGGTGTLTARATYRGVNGERGYQVVTLQIAVTLAAATLPQARVGEPYNYDVKPRLTVSGDAAYTGAGVTWSTVSSSLPAGLSLTGAGNIAGTPSVSGTGSVTARATYRNVSGQQSYSVTALPAWTYSWTQNGWSTPAACGPTTSTRSVWCLREDGTTVADANCTSAKPATTQPATDYSTCTYAWSSGTWNTPAACGPVTETRSVSCTRSDGTTVADASCTGTKPATTQASTNYSTCTYSWASGAWTTPAACGPVTQTRSVSCTRSDGTTVADASCTATKPATTQASTNYSTCTYSWTSGSWSTPAACGPVTETRSVSCTRSDGTTVADASCTGTKPATTQASTNYSTCTYAWSSGTWNTPAACGSTTSTRTVSCTRSDGTTVADASCTGTKPATTQAATNYSSCTYAWSSGSWSTPAACGATTSTRTVSCQRSDGTTVADASCTGTKPATTQAATNYSTCTYSNSYGTWGSCSASCGGGTQTRSATCMRSDGTAVSSANCPAPTTSQSCNTQSCYSYSWSTGGWSTPAGCGTVTQTRSVSCQRSDGAAMSDAYCSGTKPATTQSGTSYSTCSYSFSYGGWSGCSASCGGGTQTRSATCVRSDGATVANSSCGTPVTSQSCNTQSCYSYSWSYSGWGSCSASCGGGTQYRSATCLRSDGASVDGSYCGAAAPTAQSCNTQACAPVTGTWSASTTEPYNCQSSYSGSQLSGTCSPIGATNTSYEWRQTCYDTYRGSKSYAKITQTCR